MTTMARPAREESWVCAGLIYAIDVLDTSATGTRGYLVGGKGAKEQT